MKRLFPVTRGLPLLIHPCGFHSFVRSPFWKIWSIHFFTYCVITNIFLNFQWEKNIPKYIRNGISLFLIFYKKSIQYKSIKHKHWKFVKWLLVFNQQYQINYKLYWCTKTYLLILLQNRHHLGPTGRLSQVNYVLLWDPL